MLDELLERRAGGGDLVNDVLDRDDAELSERLLNDSVGGEGDALLVDLAVTTLVDELADGLEVGLAVGDVGLDHEEHLRRGLGDLDKHTVVDLEETEELQDLLGLGGNVVDTAAPSAAPDNDGGGTHPLMRMTKKTLG